MLIQLIVLASLMGELNLPKAYAQEKPKSKFLSRKHLRQVLVSFPPTLNFILRKKAERNANEKIFETLFTLEAVVTNKRHVSKNYLNVFIVELTAAPPFDAENFRKQAKKNEKETEKILEEGVKKAGTGGYWWKVRQTFPGITYIKYITVFGNGQQTVYLAGVYPENFEKTFIPELIKTAILSASVTNLPI